MTDPATILTDDDATWMADLTLRQMEAEQMMDPDLWPGENVLPVKRIAEPGGIETGHLVKLKLLGKTQVKPRVILASTAVLSYGDWADLVNDGWIVD